MKLYIDGISKPTNDETNELLFEIEKFLKENKQKLTEEEYKLLVVQVHEELREKLNLENKVFTIGTNKEGTKAAIIYFPKEPDGKCYDVHKDEDGKVYIIVKDEK